MSRVACTLLCCVVTSLVGSIFFLPGGHSRASAVGLAEKCPGWEHYRRDGLDAEVARCRVSGNVTAGSSRVILGEPISVSVAVDVVCDEAPVLAKRPADIVLLVDYSYSMMHLMDNLTRAKYIATEFIGNLRSDLHRLGAVVYDDRARIVSLLSTDYSPVVSGVAELTARPNSNPTSLYGALELTRDVVKGDRRTCVPAIGMILGDGGDLPPYGLETTVLAKEMRHSGIELYAVGFTWRTYQEDYLIRLVGGRDHYYDASPEDQMEAVVDGISSLRVAPRIDRLTLAVQQTSDVALVGESSTPPAMESANGLQWNMGVVGAGGYEVAYRVRPIVPGLVPAAEYIEATYTRCDGAEERVDLEVPVIQVLVPTPVEHTPTSKPSPLASSTVSPTASSKPTEGRSPTPRAPTASVTPSQAPRLVVFVPLALQ